MYSTIIHKLFLTCQETTLLLEVKNNLPLSFIQNIRLQIHLYICKNCQSYHQNLKTIDKILEGNIMNPTAEGNNDLKCQQLKTRIMKNITNEKK